MRGHEDVIKLRMTGKKPAIVFLDDFNLTPDWTTYGGPVTVSVFGDSPELLDLRLLIGLTVSICSPLPSRARRLFDACVEAGATFVIAGPMGEQDDLLFAKE